MTNAEELMAKQECYVMWSVYGMDSKGEYLLSSELLLNVERPSSVSKGDGDGSHR